MSKNINNNCKLIPPAYHTLMLEYKWGTVDVDSLKTIFESILKSYKGQKVIMIPSNVVVGVKEFDNKDDAIKQLTKIRDTIDINIEELKNMR